MSAGYVCAAATRRFHGAGATADAVFQLSELIAVRGLAAHGEHQSKGESFRVERLGVGLRLHLDVFEYVPWLEATPTAYLTTGDVPTDGAFGLAVGFGFDRLLTPTWSVGVGGAYHQVFGEDRVPAYLDVGLRVGYRWVFGDPFAP
ncbi:MAG: hypothetical protein R3F60_19875 [bacterium]